MRSAPIFTHASQPRAESTGISGITAREVERAEDDAGKPYIVRNEKIDSLVKEGEIFLSISHEHSYSVAMVVIDGKS